MKKNLVILSISLFLVLFCSLGAFANGVKKTTIILFYTTWNVSCREARATVSDVADSYGSSVDYIEMDLDSPDTIDQAADMNISVPRTVPYIVIVDKNSNILLQKQYKGESAEALKKSFDSVIKK